MVSNGESVEKLITLMVGVFVVQCATTMASSFANNQLWWRYIGVRTLMMVAKNRKIMTMKFEYLEDSDVMDAYQKNMAAFDEMNRKVKEGVSKSEAVENLKKMANFKTEVDGSMVAEHGAQNASQVVNTLKYTCLTLEHPEEWLPTWITGERRERLATELSEAMVKVVAVLNKYILKVQNISSGNSGQNNGQ